MRLRLPRFSLLTLLFFAIAIGAVMGLYWNWGPWVIVKKLPTIQLGAVSTDLKRVSIAWYGTHEVFRNKTGQFVVYEGSQLISTLESPPLFNGFAQVDRSQTLVWNKTLSERDGVETIHGWEVKTGKLRYQVSRNKTGVTISDAHENTTEHVWTDAKSRIYSEIDGRLNILVLRNSEYGFWVRSMNSKAIDLHIPRDANEWSQLKLACNGTHGLLINKQRSVLVDLRTGVLTDLPEELAKEEEWDTSGNELPPDYIAIEGSHATKSTNYLLHLPSLHVIRRESNDLKYIINYSASPDGLFLTIDELTEEPQRILDFKTGELLTKLSNIRFGRFDQNTPTATLVGTNKDSELVFYQRRRPEYWWGIAWLPEFWVFLAAMVGLVVQAVRTRRA